MVGDIKNLASEFSICSFTHVGWKANVVTHNLAHSSEPSICNLSFDVILECIREVLCTDVEQSIKRRNSPKNGNFKYIAKCVYVCGGAQGRFMRGT